RPVNPGQLLVVPLRHAAYLADISDDEAHLMRVAHRMAAALSASALRSEGVNFFLADGEAAMQEVFHVHLHMIPRIRGDGFGSPSGPTTSPARGTSSIVPQANPGALSQQIPEMRRADRA
ncbi:MAG: HIT domain-containing protein, partial [Gemmatimonadota bacterium]